MKTTYDKKADALYIRFPNGKKGVSKTLKVNDFLLFDVGNKGHLYGIEILEASSHVPIGTFFKTAKEKIKKTKQNSK